jgi:hypothetical protein
MDPGDESKCVFYLHEESGAVQHYNVIKEYQKMT